MVGDSGTNRTDMDPFQSVVVSHQSNDSAFLFALQTCFLGTKPFKILPLVVVMVGPVNDLVFRC